MMKTAIVGGGAAGFFLAVSLKEKMPAMGVTIFERSSHLLAKVAVSGGGRCNCTNSFEDVADLAKVYPRGHRLMKRLLKGFGPRDAYQWFERHGVPLVTQADHCVFPASQDSRSIVNCLLNEAHRHGVDVRTGTPVSSLDSLEDYDFIAITAGGQPRNDGLRWLREAGIETVSPVPSLFSLRIDDAALCSLMGTVANQATAFIPGTKLRADGPLLVTHWGVSGPAILKLSSYAARTLNEADYRMPLCINWTGSNDSDARDMLATLLANQASRILVKAVPNGLSARLWEYLATKTLGQRALTRCSNITDKEVRRLANTLVQDSYQTAGRAPFKDEFVTCGGVALTAVNASTLESKAIKGLYFAGEILDIDGITGGFNFQAAWTTAYTVAQAIVAACSHTI